MKLDNFSKILIATGQINYMASSLYSLNQQMKLLPDPNGFHRNGIMTKDDLLETVVKRLGAIMEDMGNLINNHDCLCALDQRVAKVPFEIIIHGQDDSEEDYEN